MGKAVRTAFCGEMRLEKQRWAGHVMPQLDSGMHVKGSDSITTL